MGRFNLKNITLNDAADITDIADNFSKIEQDGITYAEATAVATTINNGLMSAEDKSKLDNIAAGATAVTRTSQLINDSGFLTEHQDLSAKEDKSNKVTSVSSSSTDNQYPSAKLLYNQLGLKENTANKVTSISSSSTNTQYPSAKLLYDQINLRVPKTTTIAGVNMQDNITKAEMLTALGITNTGIVSQTNVISIWKGTQAQYDALTTKYSNYLYLIYEE